MTTTITEFEIIEALDFEYAPPCDNEFDDREAEWKLTVSCCGATLLFCTECKNTVLEWAANGKLTHVAEGGGCGASDVTIIICENL